MRSFTAVPSGEHVDVMPKKDHVCGYLKPLMENKLHGWSKAFSRNFSGVPKGEVISFQWEKVSEQYHVMVRKRKPGGDHTADQVDKPRPPLPVVVLFWGKDSAWIDRYDGVPQYYAVQSHLKWEEFVLGYWRRVKSEDLLYVSGAGARVFPRGVLFREIFDKYKKEDGFLHLLYQPGKSLPPAHTPWIPGTYHFSESDEF